jgi:hypothetical protein
MLLFAKLSCCQRERLRTKRMIDLPVDLIKLLATLCLNRLTGAWGFNLLLP